jgi:ketosteroid isomerase-like protein
MSQENAENLRAFLETWGREPWTLETWQQAPMIDMSFFDPEVVYEDTTLPDHIGEAYRGHEGVLRAARRWVEPNEWLLVELKQVIEAGDRLVSIHHLRSKARYTGIEFELPLAYLWTFRDGKVIHFQSYLDPQRALEAANPPEQDAHADS